MPVNFYRRIPRVVRALQFILTDSFEAELRDFCGDIAKLHRLAQRVELYRGLPILVLPGDWIVNSEPGRFTMCKADEFADRYEPFPAPQEMEPPPKPGTLQIGTNDTGMVILNHPQMETDANGCGHIAFTPDEAECLAELLENNAKVARKERERRA